VLGARDLIRRFRPTIVAETKGGWNRKEICELLDATGYSCDLFQGDSILARSSIT
jgi:hypothetical protein